MSRLGPAKVHNLVRAAGSATEVVSRPAAWFPVIAGRDPRPTRDELARLRDRERRALRAAGARWIAFSDPAYPEELRHLEHPPPGFALRGQPEALQAARLRIAVVGARCCTPYGRSQAARFGAGLAAGGAAVVSGGARGIDRAAMEAAARGGGAVVAVLGAGIDRPYPPEAAGFFDALAAGGGAVLSEFPCGVPPARGHFPRRNRILAALARGVLVVQATRKSGSMITVGWALTVGRDVFALPGPVDCSASRGPHSLLREGAILVESPGELLAHYAAPLPDAAAAEESPLLAALAEGDRTLDDLVRCLRRPPEAVLLELVDLELQGRVTRLPGGFYHRCGPGRGR